MHSLLNKKWIRVSELNKHFIMTAAELLSNHFPVLKPDDSVQTALELMQEQHTTVLPVVQDEKYIGLLHEDDLQDADPQTQLSTFLPLEDRSQVAPFEFFLHPLKIMHQRKLSLLPVVKEGNEYLGVITAEDLLQAASHYNAATEPGGVIILQMLPYNFSISEIGRIVESNDAKIIHLNTWTDTSSGQLMVAIKVNKSDIQDILASLERYEYHVVQYFGENLSEDELKLNYDHLMHYLKF